MQTLLFTVEDSYSMNLEPPINDDTVVQKNDFLLKCVLQCIDENLSNKQFSVEILSLEVGLGERQLQRKLKAITNKSPNQLIRSVRLHRAKSLLIKRSATITEIAFLTGFANPSYFSKVFKKEFGIRPSEL